MEKLSKEDYREAKNCLKKYNYNCIRIMSIKLDIMGLSSVNVDGMPRAPYKISDSVLNSVILLQEDEQLQKCTKEYKAVVQALLLVDKIANKIFEEEYQKRKRQ